MDGVRYMEVSCMIHVEVTRDYYWYPVQPGWFTSLHVSLDMWVLNPFLFSISLLSLVKLFQKCGPRYKNAFLPTTVLIRGVLILLVSVVLVRRMRVLSSFINILCNPDSLL